MQIVNPAPAITSVPIVIEPSSSSSQEQQIHQDVADYGQGITANPGTLNSFDSLTMPLPFISTVSPLGFMSLKDQNNEFVHLNKLPYHDPTSTQTNQTVFEDVTFQIKPKIKEQKIVNISQCMDAFLIFGSIYLVNHPSEVQTIYLF